jgi:hypothetical protein
MKISGTAIGLAIVGLIVIGVIAWLTPWVHLDNSPKPLGDRLEYVGKFDYGCIGCDAAPGAAYYYATDMKLEEVVGYFRGAKLIKLQVESKSTFVQLENGKEKFTFDYYTPKNQSQLGDFEIRFRDKNMIDIDAKYYATAKDSL